MALPWSSHVRGNEPKLMKAEDFDEKKRAFPFEDQNHPFITITPRGVTFNLQLGPVKEVGMTGCQLDDILNLVLGTVRVLNAKYPCRENSIAITKLEEAMLWFEARRLDRVARNVEGLNKA